MHGLGKVKEHFIKTKGKEAFITENTKVDNVILNVVVVRGRRMHVVHLELSIDDGIHERDSFGGNGSKRYESLREDGEEKRTKRSKCDETLKVRRMHEHET